jgi:hypothetical protein
VSAHEAGWLPFLFTLLCGRGYYKDKLFAKSLCLHSGLLQEMHVLYALQNLFVLENTKKKLG